MSEVEWKLKSLKDLSVSITSGMTPLKNNSEFWDNPVVPWLKTDQLGEKYIWDTNTKISEIALEKTSLKLYPSKTLSIAMYGEGKTRGNISIIMKPMATNQACCNIVINEEKTDFEYVYYYMKTQYESLRSLSSGVRNNLNANDIKNYEIRIPESLVEQNNISKVLSVLDQKIALNNQINEELEAMAKTLYNYWFVQFDFPDENGKPYKSSGGKMVYNDQLKREIPEGWGVKRLGEICNPTSGYPFASNTYVQDGKFKIYTIKNVQDNGILPITDNTLDTLPANLPEKCILGPGDMLMSLTGNVGRVGIVFEDNALLNQRVLKIESKYKAFIFQFLKDPRTRSLLENTATGTSQKNLSPKDVMDISIIFPGFNVLIEFEQISNEILLQITSNNQQNQELTQLRDWLLPMLMNGQVKVEDKT